MRPVPGNDTRAKLQIMGWRKLRFKYPAWMRKSKKVNSLFTHPRWNPHHWASLSCSLGFFFWHRFQHSWHAPGKLGALTSLHLLLTADLVEKHSFCFKVSLVLLQCFDFVLRHKLQNNFWAVTSFPTYLCSCYDAVIFPLHTLFREMECL